MVRICLQCRRCQRCRFSLWVGETLWGRKWQPTPVFLPAESQGRRSLVGFSSWGRQESDTTERLHFHVVYIHTYTCVHAQSLQSCMTLCNPMDCSLPGSSVHGTSQARILEWAVISFSKGSSPPRDRTQISCIGRRILHH